MSELFDYLSTSGTDHALLAAQQGDAISRAVQWIPLILAAIVLLGSAWSARIEWDRDINKALMIFNGGVLLSVLLLLLLKILDIAEQITPF